MKFESSKSFSEILDKKDELASFRERFHIPKASNGKPFTYFVGNSLGLQPKTTQSFVQEELDAWAKIGIEAHFQKKNPWYSYHETVLSSLARLTGAKTNEVVAMNALSVNLHLLMASFYRPTSKRYKILIESHAFPSDQYAVASQARVHGFNPEQAILELPATKNFTSKHDEIMSYIEKNGHEIALVLLGGVNYLTGQAFRFKEIAEKVQEKGAFIGLDLAHGTGNLDLKLHDWNIDFAVWCSYKYLNSGPGAVAGCFVHEKHCGNPSIPRFEGWWGHNKQTRFKFDRQFDPMNTAEAWQISNPPILHMAALRASLQIFDEVPLEKLHSKKELLSSYLEFLLKEKLGDYCAIITPSDLKQRGCQISFQIKGDPKHLQKTLYENGTVADFREPNIIRVAPVPLYNTFSEVFHFVEQVSDYAKQSRN